MASIEYFFNQASTSSTTQNDKSDSDEIEFLVNCNENKIVLKLCLSESNDRLEECKKVTIHESVNENYENNILDFILGKPVNIKNIYSSNLASDYPTECVNFVNEFYNDMKHFIVRNAYCKPRGLFHKDR